MGASISYRLEDPVRFKRQLVQWTSGYRVSCVLDSNQYIPDTEVDFVAGIDAMSEIEVGQRSAFDALKHFHEQTKDWIFGFLTYDLKNEVEDLTSQNEDHLEFPGIHFFQPKYLVRVKDGSVQVSSADEDVDEMRLRQLLDEILNCSGEVLESEWKMTVRSRVSKSQYVDAVNRIKAHIDRGDIYELNYCQEFYADGAQVDPQALYLRLNALSPSPYSCFYRLDEQYLLSSSPERFMAGKGRRMISQPIKGTIRRGKDESEDEQLKVQLFNDPKERAENIMIVDLVRNDLSRTAARGSVKVEELCGIYTFPQVHQMISTVTAELKEGCHFTEAIAAAFPMGSMTGAPKVRAMKLIEEYEYSKRGLYSGAVGYVTPEGDFDFNVVIRSMLYNARNQYLSFQAGSAITAASDAEYEYQECLLKAMAMKRILGANEKEDVVID